MSKLVVVIPALNEENLITRTLESLNNQTNTDFSVIIVDNNSTDSTVEVVKNYAKTAKYPLITISEKQPGVGHARNAGMLKALELGAMYIAGTDADTVLPSNWVDSIYSGFNDSRAELLCGECDPMKIVKINNEKVQFVLNARSILARQVKPYCRGANYAITAATFRKVGGIKQPLSKDGKPAPGEDGQLEIDVMQNGGKPAGCLATVFPHPRRYISNIQNIAKFDGGVHEGGVVTQVRDENQLEDILKNLPSDVVDQFADKVIVSIFSENVIDVYKEPMFKKVYWAKSLKMLKPFTETEIEEDLRAHKDLNYLWDKYKAVFIQNIKKFL